MVTKAPRASGCRVNGDGSWRSLTIGVNKNNESRSVRSIQKPDNQDNFKIGCAGFSTLDLRVLIVGTLKRSDSAAANKGLVSRTTYSHIIQTLDTCAEELWIFRDPWMAVLKQSIGQVPTDTPPALPIMPGIRAKLSPWGYVGVFPGPCTALNPCTPLP